MGLNDLLILPMRAINDEIGRIALAAFSITKTAGDSNRRLERLVADAGS